MIVEDYPKELTLQHQQQLIAFPSEPAPVHEEQNEPPPPPPRTRAGLDPNMLNPAGYAVDAANLFLAQGLVNRASVGAAPGVVQLARPIVPNGSTQIVNPPPQEMIPTTNVQPLSIDPATGEPLRSVSPKFRAFLAPNAPPVNVPAPVQTQFGRGFGGSPILDVTGSNPQQAQISAGGGLSYQDFPQPSTTFQPQGNEGGNIISIQTFGGATSSANSNSQSFSLSPIAQQNESPFASLQAESSNGRSSHTVHINLPESSYSSTVFHGDSN
jgi:hypothetical protein